MIIGFDGRYAEGDLVGIGKYIKYLLLELDTLGISCIIFYSKKPKLDIKGKNIKSVVLNSNNRYFFEQILLPKALLKYKASLYHAVGNVGVPLFSSIPAILTVHDIIPLKIKDYFSYSPFPFLSKLSYLLRLKTSLAKSYEIITVSDFVKKELIVKLAVNKNKIQTIYSGVSMVASAEELPDTLVGKKYILNHGGIDIRKNLDKLIESFAIFYKKYPKINLVITGDNKRIRMQLDKLVERYDLGKSVIFTGYISDEVLASVIKNALMICYPTLSEGFGLPILEGFAARVPVISSNTSSIPEISGDAAILINPKNELDISNAMEKVITDTKFRKRMISKGYRQYTKFSWRKSVNEYINLYKSLGHHNK